MSIGLTTKELTSIRADVNDLLPDTGYIITVAETADGMGGNSEGTSIAAGGTTSYRIDPETFQRLRSGEMVYSGALQPFHKFILTLPYDTTITTNNRFLGKDGDYYNVVSIDDDKSWIASVRAFVERR